MISEFSYSQIRLGWKIWLIACYDQLSRIVISGAILKIVRCACPMRCYSYLLNEITTSRSSGEAVGHVSSCLMKGLVKHIACQPLLIYCLCLSIRPLCVDGLERISVRDFRLYGFPSESELPASPSLRNGWRHPHFGVGISAFLAQYRLNCCSYKAVLEFVKRQRCERSPLETQARTFRYENP